MRLTTGAFQPQQKPVRLSVSRIVMNASRTTPAIARLPHSCLRNLPARPCNIGWPRRTQSLNFLGLQCDQVCRPECRSRPSCVICLVWQVWPITSRCGRCCHSIGAAGSISAHRISKPSTAAHPGMTTVAAAASNIVGGGSMAPSKERLTAAARLIEDTQTEDPLFAALRSVQVTSRSSREYVLSSGLRCQHLAPAAACWIGVLMHTRASWKSQLPRGIFQSEAGLLRREAVRGLLYVLRLGRAP